MSDLWKTKSSLNLEAQKTENHRNNIKNTKSLKLKTTTIKRP